MNASMMIATELRITRAMWVCGTSPYTAISHGEVWSRTRPATVNGNRYSHGATTVGIMPALLSLSDRCVDCAGSKRSPSFLLAEPDQEDRPARQRHRGRDHKKSAGLVDEIGDALKARSDAESLKRRQNRGKTDGVTRDLPASGFAAAG